MKIIPYEPKHAVRWNQFIHTARNGSFLFDRNYMDYHADRFEDASVILEKAGTIVAVLPANRNGKVVCSHEGLTFGGFIIGNRMRLQLMEQVVDATLDYYGGKGFSLLRYSPMPLIYFKHPSQEDLAVLLNRGATLVRSKTSSVCLASAAPSHSVRRNVLDAARKGIVIDAWTDVSGFYAMLANWLQLRYQATPVHTLEELTLLCKRFPENIRIIAAWHQGQPVAATLIFANPTCQRFQYGALTPAGLKLNARKALDAHLVSSAPAGTWMDFGTSMLPGTDEISHSLHLSKELVGARAMLQCTYEIPLRSAHENRL